MLLETNEIYATPADQTGFAPGGNSVSPDRNAASRQVIGEPARRRMGAAMECYISAYRLNPGRTS